MTNSSLQFNEVTVTSNQKKKSDKLNIRTQAVFGKNDVNKTDKNDIASALQEVKAFNNFNDVIYPKLVKEGKIKVIKDNVNIALNISDTKKLVVFVMSIVGATNYQVNETEINNFLVK